MKLTPLVYVLILEFVTEYSLGEGGSGGRTLTLQFVRFYVLPNEFCLIESER